MFGNNSFHQREIEEVYNLLVDVLQPIDPSIEKLNEDGDCCGITYARTFYGNKSELNDSKNKLQLMEFMSCLKLMPAIKGMTNINEFIEKYANAQKTGKPLDRK